jgi:hypothetical protein
MAPEAVAHGSEILLQALGPGSSGQYVTLAEVFDLTYDDDNKVEPLVVFGTRRTGYRRGRFEVKGTIKAYWLYSSIRTMLLGAANPAAAGAAGSIAALYLSQVPFTRYNMTIINANWPGSAIVAPSVVLVNVVLEKDTMRWAADKPTFEDVTFFAEDVLGQ